VPVISALKVAVAPEEISIDSAKPIPNAAAFTVMLSLTVP
jgi:hypothetical protein